jgi:hypothetical protein
MAPRLVTLDSRKKWVCNTKLYDIDIFSRIRPSVSQGQVLMYIENDLMKILGLTANLSVCKNQEFDVAIQL